MRHAYGTFRSRLYISRKTAIGHLPHLFQEIREYNGFRYLPNLLELNISKTRILPEDLNTLGFPTSLKTLSIKWCKEREFPDLSHWPQLRTFAITIEEVTNGSIGNFALFKPVTYSNLTRLYIDEDQCSFHVTSSEVFTGWFSPMCSAITLPRLRSFTLRYSCGLFEEIYTFIQRHPSILEVNLSTVDDDLWLSFDALTKLIEGTSTTTYGRSGDGSSDYCNTTQYVMDRDCIPFWSFGFTRIPDTTTSCHLPNSRFLATSLSLEQVGLDGDLIQFLRFGSLHVFSKLETLRLLLKSCTEENEGASHFPSIMVSQQVDPFPYAYSY